MVEPEFGRRLRTALAWRGVSGSELARHLGVSAQAVAKFNAGKMLPSASRLMEITRFLSVSVDYLMGGDDVAGQVEDVMNNRPPRMTQRQEAQRTGARVARSGE